MANDSGLFGLGDTPPLGGAFASGKSKKKMQAIIDALAEKGRNGDTMLAHINPQEAALLDKVTDGGSINPRTGLPEFADDSGQVSNATGASGSNWGGGGYSGGGYGGSSGYSGGYVSNGGVFGPGETFTDPLTGGSYQANSGGGVSYIGGGAGHDAYVGSGGAGYAPSDYNTRYAYQPSGHLGNTSWGYNSETNPIRRPGVPPTNELTVEAPVPPANIPPPHPVSKTPETAYGQPTDQGIPGETIDYQTPMDVFSAFNQWAPTVNWSDPNTYAQPSRSQTKAIANKLGNYPSSWARDNQFGWDQNWNGKFGQDPNVTPAAYNPDFSFNPNGTIAGPANGIDWGSISNGITNANNALNSVDWGNPNTYANGGSGPSVALNPRRGGLWGQRQTLPGGTDMYNSGPGSDWYQGPNGETLGVNRRTGEIGYVNDPQEIGLRNTNATSGYSPR